MDLFDKIRKKTVEAIAQYHLIEDGEKVLVAVSGGKDSSILYWILKDIQRRAKITFDLAAVMLDQGQPGFQSTQYLDWMKNHNLPVQMISEDTYSIVQEKTAKGKSFCGLCSRLRRGILYNYAAEHGFNKIALGHHRNDANETLILNLIHNGRLASMPPRLKADDGRNKIIRPFYFIDEEDIRSLSTQLGIPTIPCNLCGSQKGLQRVAIKKLLQELSVAVPNLQANMSRAQTNIRPTQLGDTSLLSLW